MVAWPIYQSLSIAERQRLTAWVIGAIDFHQCGMRHAAWYRDDGRYVPELANFLRDKDHRYWRSQVPPDLEAYDPDARQGTEPEADLDDPAFQRKLADARLNLGQITEDEHAREIARIEGIAKGNEPYPN